MGTKTLILPHGTLKVDLLTHHTAQEEQSILQTAKYRDKNGIPSGFLADFSLRQTPTFDSNQDLLLFERLHPISPNVLAEPQKKKEEFMEITMAPAFAENLNQMLREYRAGQRAHLSLFLQHLAETPVDIAFVDVVPNSDGMDRQYEQTSKDNDTIGSIIQLGGTGIGILPWLRKSEKGKINRREFLKKMGWTGVCTAVSGVTGSILKEEGFVQPWIKRQLTNPGEITGFRELARQINGLRISGDPLVELRNAIMARKTLELMKKMRKKNAKIYVGYGHTDLPEHILSTQKQKSTLERYATSLEQYIDIPLSENVIYLRYDHTKKEYVESVIKLPGILRP